MSHLSSSPPYSAFLYLSFSATACLHLRRIQPFCTSLSLLQHVFISAAFSLSVPLFLCYSMSSSPPHSAFLYLSFSATACLHLRRIQPFCTSLSLLQHVFISAVFSLSVPLFLCYSMSSSPPYSAFLYLSFSATACLHLRRIQPFCTSLSLLQHVFISAVFSLSVPLFLCYSMSSSPPYSAFLYLSFSATACLHLRRIQPFCTSLSLLQHVFISAVFSLSVPLFLCYSMSSSPPHSAFLYLSFSATACLHLRRIQPFCTSLSLLQHVFISAAFSLSVPLFLCYSMSSSPPYSAFLYLSFSATACLHLRRIQPFCTSLSLLQHVFISAAFSLSVPLFLCYSMSSSPPYSAFLYLSFSATACLHLRRIQPFCTSLSLLQHVFISAAFSLSVPLFLCYSMSSSPPYSAFLYLSFSATACLHLRRIQPFCTSLSLLQHVFISAAFSLSVPLFLCYSMSSSPPHSAFLYLSFSATACLHLRRIQPFCTSLSLLQHVFISAAFSLSVPLFLCYSMSSSPPYSAFLYLSFSATACLHLRRIQPFCTSLSLLQHVFISAVFSLSVPLFLCYSMSSSPPYSAFLYLSFSATACLHLRRIQPFCTSLSLLQHVFISAAFSLSVPLFLCYSMSSSPPHSAFLYLSFSATACLHLRRIQPFCTSLSLLQHVFISAVFSLSVPLFLCYSMSSSPPYSAFLYLSFSATACLHLRRIQPFCTSLSLLQHVFISAVFSLSVPLFLCYSMSSSPPYSAFLYLSFSATACLHLRRIQPFCTSLSLLQHVFISAAFSLSVPLFLCYSMSSSPPHSAFLYLSFSATACLHLRRIQPFCTSLSLLQHVFISAAFSLSVPLFLCYSMSSSPPHSAFLYLSFSATACLHLRRIQPFCTSLSLLQHVFISAVFSLSVPLFLCYSMSSSPPYSAFLYLSFSATACLHLRRIQPFCTSLSLLQHVFISAVFSLSVPLFLCYSMSSSPPYSAFLYLSFSATACLHLRRIQPFCTSLSLLQHVFISAVFSLSVPLFLCYSMSSSPPYSAFLYLSFSATACLHLSLSPDRCFSQFFSRHLSVSLIFF